MVLAIAGIWINQQEPLASRGLQQLPLSHRLDQFHRSLLHSCDESKKMFIA
jgi:hypothetical protein